MSKKDAKKEPAKKHMDVTRPGEAAPSASSRPIVVTHQPRVADPMVNKRKTDSITGAPAVEQAGSTVHSILDPRKPRLKVEPLPNSGVVQDNAGDLSKPLHDPGSVVKPANEDNKPKSEELDSYVEKQSEDKNVAEPEAELEKSAKGDGGSEKEPEQPENKVSEPDRTGESPSDEQPQPEGIVDELAKQAAAKKKRVEDDKEGASRKERIDSLVASKQYNVPIGQLTKRRNTIALVIVLLLIVLIGLAAANFALDAGLIDVDIEPLTDIIKN